MKKIYTVLCLFLCLSIQSTLHAEFSLLKGINNAYLWWYDDGEYDFDQEISRSIDVGSNLFIEQLADRKASQGSTTPFKKGHLDEAIKRKRHLTVNTIVQRGNGLIREYVQGSDKADTLQSPCYKALEQLDDKDENVERQQQASFIAGLLMQHRKRYDKALLIKVSSVFRQDDDQFGYVARHIPRLHKDQYDVSCANPDDIDDLKRYAHYRKDIFARIFDMSAGALRSLFLRECKDELRAALPNMSYEDKKVYVEGDHTALRNVLQKKELSVFIRDLVSKQKDANHNPETDTLIEECAADCRAKISKMQGAWEESEKKRSRIALSHKLFNTRLDCVLKYIFKKQLSDDIEEISAQPIVLSEAFEYLQTRSYWNEQFQRGCSVCLENYDTGKAIFCCANKHMVCLSCFNNPAFIKCPSCRSALGHDRLRTCQLCGVDAEIKLVYCKDCETISSSCKTCEKYPCCDKPIGALNDEYCSRIQDHYAQMKGELECQFRNDLDRMQDEEGAKIRDLDLTLREKLRTMESEMALLSKKIEKDEAEIKHKKAYHPHHVNSINAKIDEANLKINQYNSLKKQARELIDEFNEQIGAAYLRTAYSAQGLRQLYDQRESYLESVRKRSIPEEKA